MACSNPYGLQDRQWLFVQEYLVDLDASAAYRRAGYRASTPGSVWSSACLLLKNPKVQAALRAERDRLMSTLDVTPEKVLRELARLGFSDMRKYMTWGADGVSLAPSDQLDDDAAAAIAEVSEESRSVGEVAVRHVKFKLHSKIDGLNGLAKHLDLYGEGKALGELGQGLAALLAQAKQFNAGP